MFATVNPDAGIVASPRSWLSAASGFTVGKKEDKLGIRAAARCGCHVKIAASRARMARRSRGADTGAIERSTKVHRQDGAAMIGLAQGALDSRVAYTKERKQIGSGSPTSKASSSAAQAATELEAARLLVYNAARRATARAVPHGGCDVQALFIQARGTKSRPSLCSCSADMVCQGIPRLEAHRDAKMDKPTKGTRICNCRRSRANTG